MIRGIRTIFLALGLVLTSTSGHAFLDNILGSAKSADKRRGAGAESAAGQAAGANVADKALLKPIDYVNGALPGPTLVVLPGEIRSNNASFNEKFGPNNVADFGEVELRRANFKVLERTGLGSVLREVQVAYALGDAPEANKVFKRGKFKTTQWMVTFDVIKAEVVAQAHKGFDARTAGQVAGMILFGPVGVAAAVAVGSVKTNEAAETWLVGMRYTIVDASTTEQVATGYVEEKMGIGARAASILGVGVAGAGGLSLDSMVQRLVQACVAEIDASHKTQAAATPETPPEVRAELPVDNDKELAELFDPVKVKQLAAIFPDAKWGQYAERAGTNGLADAASDSSGQFNPYLATLWWWKSQNPAKLTWDDCKQKLAEHLPARSRASAYLLTQTSVRGD